MSTAPEERKVEFKKEQMFFLALQNRYWSDIIEGQGGEGMIRLFEFRDLDKIMNIWLQGNLEAHSFIDAGYWEKNFDSVKSVLPNAEVYVYEEDGEVLGFIGMDADYIEGIFVAAGHKGQGIGHQLIGAVKQKKRLSLHVFEKNTGAMSFYLAEGFKVWEKMTEKETGETECLMVYEDGQ